MLQQICVVLVLLGVQDSSTEARALGENIKKAALAQLGKKVGDGECFTFVKTILEDNGCKTALDYKDGSWGDPVKVDDAQVGDVIQMKDVKLVFKQGAMTYTNTFPTHTRVIIEKRGKGKFVVLEQNVALGKTADPKVVQKHDFDMKDLKEGAVSFYRPVKK